MPDGLAKLDELREPGLLTVFQGQNPPIGLEAFAQNFPESELAFREQVNQDRAEQAEMAALIGQPAAGDLDADWLANRAEMVRAKETEFTETLRPVISSLKNLLVPGVNLEPRVAQLVRDSIEVLEAWPHLYHDLGNWLFKLAADRELDQVTRARPVKGKIDHEALTREIIARYPKILAALAK